MTYRTSDHFAILIFVETGAYCYDSTGRPAQRTVNRTCLNVAVCTVALGPFAGSQFLSYNKLSDEDSSGDIYN